MTEFEHALQPPASRRRLVAGTVIVLASVAAAVAAVLFLADHSSVGPDPRGGDLSVEFTLAAAVSLGWGLFGAVEGWIRGDRAEDWLEALFYRAFVGGVAVFGVVVAGVIALERLGVGPANL